MFCSFNRFGEREVGVSLPGNLLFERLGIRGPSCSTLEGVSILLLQRAG